MRRLICSGFRVMFRHSLLIWITVTASVLLGTVGGFFGCMEANIGEYSYETGVLYLTLLPVLLLILFSLVAVIGQEHGSGTLRNKLIAGYRKGAVSCAWLVCALSFALICAVLWLTPFLLLSRRATVVLSCAVQCRFALTLLMLFLTVGAAGGLFSLLFRRQAAAVFLAVAAAMLLFFGASFASAQLARVQYTETRVMKYRNPDTGAVSELSEEAARDSAERSVIIAATTILNKNPYYVDSPLREAVIILNKLNPAAALLSAADSLESISTAQELSRMIRMLEADKQYLQDQLDMLEGSEDPDDAERRSQISRELTEMRGGYWFYETERLQTELQQTTDGTEGVPRCLFGVLTAFLAAGVGIFRKKDIV